MAQNKKKVNALNCSQGIEIGIYTLGDHAPDPHTGKRISAKERLNQIIEMATLAEQAGLDLFQVGESHQEHFVSQAHLSILSYIAAKTEKITIASGATIISTSDPIRVFENAATIDLLSNERMELVVGRASRTGSHRLLGYDLTDYEELFEEKFDLLLEINRNKYVTWSGEYRPPLEHELIIPRPNNDNQDLPIWRAVGGSLSSIKKAALQGVPIYLSHIEGNYAYYKMLIDEYRNTLKNNNQDSKAFPIATAGFLYLSDNNKKAIHNYYSYVDHGLKLVNGHGISKDHFYKASEKTSVINVGDPMSVVEKMLFQYEQFGHQRYIGQIDFGGVPMEEIKRTIDLLATKVIPQVKKYTKQ